MPKAMPGSGGWGCGLPWAPSGRDDDQIMANGDRMIVFLPRLSPISLLDGFELKRQGRYGKAPEILQPAAGFLNTCEHGQVGAPRSGPTGAPSFQHRPRRRCFRSLPRRRMADSTSDTARRARRRQEETSSHDDRHAVLWSGSLVVWWS
jgi:hypothetical protein